MNCERRGVQETGECAEGAYIVWGSGALQFVWARISACEFRFLSLFFFPPLSLSRWPVLCWDINLIRMLGGRDIKLARIFMGYIMGGINRRGALVFRRGEKRRGRCATCDVIFEVPLR
jgi:hypothetical protein